VKEKDPVMSIVWIMLGLVISIWSATFPFGGLKAPGPAFLPLACGLILIILGLILLLNARVGKTDSTVKPSEQLFPQGAAGLRVTLTLGGLLLSAILLEPLGFFLTVFFLILFLMRAVQPQKWSAAVLYALVCAGGALVVFKVLLKTQLPGGFLGF
jgi:hypothetical protein